MSLPQQNQQSKILFLDIDGVMVTWKSGWDQKTGRSIFDEACVNALNDLIDSTGAKIVISSTWRNGYTIKELQELFRDNGFWYSENIIGKTPELQPENLGERIRWPLRGEQIQSWLTSAKHDFSNICILDDDDDMSLLIDKLIQTDWEDGLTPGRAKKAKGLLNETVKI
jgi:hypothetical protein